MLSGKGNSMVVVAVVGADVEDAMGIAKSFLKTVLTDKPKLAKWRRNMFPHCCP